MNVQSADKQEPKKDQTPDGKQQWQPMMLRYLGNIRTIVQGGRGKLSLTGGDPGEYRKPRGRR